MTRRKGQWTAKDEEYFLILMKLVIEDKKLKATDFESPRNVDSIDRPGYEDKGLPHSSVVECLKELTKEQSIEKEIVNNSKERAIRYRITQFGFIKLLGLCNNKSFVPDVWNKISMFLAFSNELEDLQVLFTKKQLFDVLTWVCKNFSIEISFDSNPPTQKRPLPRKRLSPKTFPLENPWRIYEIRLQVQQFRTTITYNRVFGLFGTENDKVRQYARFLFFTRSLIFSTFMYELTMRCVREDEKFREYRRGGQALERVTKYSRHNNSFLPFYRRFVNDILSISFDEYFHTNKISKILKNKDKSRESTYFQNELEDMMKQSGLIF